VDFLFDFYTLWGLFQCCLTFLRCKSADLAVCCGILCTKAYSQPYLNVNNSKFWRATLISFSEIVHRIALCKVIAWNPQYTGNLWGQVHLKTTNSTKFTIFDASYTKCVRRLSPTYSKFLRGPRVYQMHFMWSVYVRRFVC